MPHSGSRNRGPAAAAENRAAILAAARTVFSTRGYRVPLSAIAREAGVSQGVLYRHFRHRLELAYAVFADNFAELEQIADAHPGPEAFGLLWRRLVGFTLESSAFVDMVIDAHAEFPESISQRRLQKLMDGPLRRAQAEGLADPDWTVDDIVLLHHMVHGVAGAQPERSLVLPAVERALRLVDPRLAEALAS